MGICVTIDADDIRVLFNPFLESRRGTWANNNPHAS